MEDETFHGLKLITTITRVRNRQPLDLPNLGRSVKSGSTQVHPIHRTWHCPFAPPPTLRALVLTYRTLRTLRLLHCPFHTFIRSRCCPSVKTGPVPSSKSCKADRPPSPEHACARLPSPVPSKASVTNALSTCSGIHGVRTHTPLPRCPTHTPMCPSTAVCPLPSWWAAPPARGSTTSHPSPKQPSSHVWHPPVVTHPTPPQAHALRTAGRPPCS